MKILVLFNSMSPLFHAILSFTEVVMESLHDFSPLSLLPTESPQLSLVKQPGLNTSHGAFPVLASVQYGFFSDQGFPYSILFKESRVSGSCVVFDSQEFE